MCTISFVKQKLQNRASCKTLFNFLATRQISIFLGLVKFIPLKVREICPTSGNWTPTPGLEDLRLQEA